MYEVFLKITLCFAKELENNKVSTVFPIPSLTFYFWLRRKYNRKWLWNCALCANVVRNPKFSLMPFINTLPYISNPIEEFSDFKYVSWEKEIYPKFKGGTEPKEVQFFAEILKRHNIKSILDLGIGGGIELAGIAKHLQSEKYGLTSIEGNEIDDDFI